MSPRFPPISPKLPHMMHGADYNPEQWIDQKGILEEDMRLMKLAGCNAMSIGIFSWVALEPEEGKFRFDWMDRVMDVLAEHDACAVLATPSGSKPAWMSRAYPEICRVGPDGRRERHYRRHNHCRTSPVYREKCATINAMLAERYKDHPALAVWHVSNELNSEECHCELCYDAFREWLKTRYGSLDALNKAWWTTFWSHTFTDWDLIEPVDNSIHGLMLDWKRFISDQTLDFVLNESKPLREITPDVPVTINMMGVYQDLDYWKFAPHLDVISWDSYPKWHGARGDVELASDTAFLHDLNRSLKGGKPFMLMESTPSMANWDDVGRSKRPGMNVLSSLQAVAHGSDTVQYFQWRKSRGGWEKFHGAVVDHVGTEHTREFDDGAEVGRILAKLDPGSGCSVEPEVAIVYDWESRWDCNMARGYQNRRKNVLEQCFAHHRPFWKRGIPVDVIDSSADFSKYRLVIAPMLYMVREGVGERIEAFVRAGGTFVTTYFSGMVNENDLCFLGGFPGPLRGVTGVWAEEIDALYPEQTQGVVSGTFRPVAEVPADGRAGDDNPLGLSGEYAARDLAAILHPEGAEVLAVYGQDYYKGTPALTVNRVGDGAAYYVASRNDERFTDDFCGGLAKELELRRALDSDLPEGVTAQVREGDGRAFVFVMNFKPGPQTVDLGARNFADLLTGEAGAGALELPGYGVRVLERK